jgi:hypothetical protein
MVWTTGEQKPFKRMIDARVAIVWNGALGRDVHTFYDAGADIENGGLVKENGRRLSGFELFHQQLLPRMSMWPSNEVCPARIRNICDAIDASSRKSDRKGQKLRLH